MNSKSLKMLEYEKIIAKLKKYAITEMGTKKCEELIPENEFNIVKRMQKETSEAVSISLRIGNPPIIPIGEFEPIVKKIKIGGVLIPKELLNVATTLKSMREVKEFFNEITHDEYEILNLYFENLYSNLNVVF